MNISKHIAKGEQHKVFCEDFIIEEKINDKYRLFGVFDGCSSGETSHFASALFGKSVVNACKSVSCSNTYDFLKNIIWNTFKKVSEIQKLLNLSQNELLTTIILLIIDCETEICSAIAFADGLISVNYAIRKIDQNNTPDYLIYHFSEFQEFSDFDVYISKQIQYKNISFKDLTISTDGIFSFTDVNNQITENEIVDYFVLDEFLKNNPAMLARKHNILRNKKEAINSDDIAIIRISV